MCSLETAGRAPLHRSQEPAISRNRATASAAAALAFLGLIPACIRRAAYQDELEAVARGAALRRARSFIAAVGSADPGQINKHLADGLEFKPHPRIERYYSFYWKGKKVIGPLRLEYYGDPKTFTLTIEEGGEKIRIWKWRPRYDYFILTNEGVSYSGGEIAEILADLKAGGRRLVRAARWLQTHPRPELVPDLIEMSDEHYEVKTALRVTTYQGWWRTVDWKQWYEANGSRSREEWWADARKECLALLESDDLSTRIVGTRVARAIGGMEEEALKAITFPDEAYTTSISTDAGGLFLVITNASPRPALISVRTGVGEVCGHSLTGQTTVGGFRVGGGRRRSSLPATYHLRVLEPGQNVAVRVGLSKDLVPGDYRVKASLRDEMNGRKYEASFEFTVPPDATTRSP